MARVVMKTSLIEYEDVRRALDALAREAAKAFAEHIELAAQSRPAIPEGCTMEHCFKRMEQMLEFMSQPDAGVQNLMVIGPPGTGKSHAAIHHALRPGTYARNVTLTDDMPSVELRGHYVLTVDPDSKREHFVWMDGAAIEAMREGSRLVINEVGHAGPDMLSFIMAITDNRESIRITLPNQVSDGRGGFINEVVTPAPGYHVIATMNEPLDTLPMALRDRFPIVIMVDDVAPGALLSLPETMRSIARQSALNQKGNERVSMRKWIAYAALLSKMEPKQALEFIMPPYQYDKTVTKAVSTALKMSE